MPAVVSPSTAVIGTIWHKLHTPRTRDSWQHRLRLDLDRFRESEALSDAKQTCCLSCHVGNSWAPTNPQFHGTGNASSKYFKCKASVLQRQYGTKPGLCTTSMSLLLSIRYMLIKLSVSSRAPTERT